MTIKLALKNLYRIPWRTILYFLVIFLVVVAVTASVFVFKACVGAKTSLDESYIFVASIVPKKSLTLADMQYCVTGSDALSFNIEISENNSVIAGGKNMFRLPEKVPLEEAVEIWKDETKCVITAVENLYLVRSFFTGECKITSGTALTKEGYTGSKAEIVLPWWFAEKYNVSVGDTVVRQYNRSVRKDYMFSVDTNPFFIESRVVGIYTADASPEEYEKYPAYMPFAIAELDYSCASGATYMSTKEFKLGRADFVLRGRNSFDGFVRNAEKNGLNFKNVDIIFNNSSYDVLSEQLENVRVIALIVLLTVAFVGLCVFIFFTAYFNNSRKKEKAMLRALGMKKSSIFAMMVIELTLIICVAAATGFFAGRAASSAVCDHVNTSVLAEAAESASVRNTASRIASGTAPLERHTVIEISTKGGKADIPQIPVNYVTTVGEGEVGIGRHEFYDLRTIDFDTFKKNAWLPHDCVGVSDFDGIELTTVEEWQKYPDMLSCYVSEDADISEFMQYSDVPCLYLSSVQKGAFVRIGNGKVDESFLAGECVLLFIKGTYKPNKYCSGTDILMSLDDYHKLYSKFSVTDENFYFKRINEVVKKETP